MDASELRTRARQEADELGPEPPGAEAELWREERWGAVVLLAGLGDDNVELLRQAANEIRPGSCPVVVGCGDPRRGRRLTGTLTC